MEIETSPILKKVKTKFNINCFNDLQKIQNELFTMAKENERKELESIKDASKHNEI